MQGSSNYAVMFLLLQIRTQKIRGMCVTQAAGVQISFSFSVARCIPTILLTAKIPIRRLLELLACRLRLIGCSHKLQARTCCRRRLQPTDTTPHTASGAVDIPVALTSECRTRSGSPFDSNHPVPHFVHGSFGHRAWASGAIQTSGTSRSGGHCRFVHREFSVNSLYITLRSGTEERAYSSGQLSSPRPPTLATLAEGTPCIFTARKPPPDDPLARLKHATAGDPAVCGSGAGGGTVEVRRRCPADPGGHRAGADQGLLYCGPCAGALCAGGQRQQDEHGEGGGGGSEAAPDRHEGAADGQAHGRRQLGWRRQRHSQLPGHEGGGDCSTQEAPTRPQPVGGSGAAACGRRQHPQPARPAAVRAAHGAAAGHAQRRQHPVPAHLL